MRAVRWIAALAIAAFVAPVGVRADEFSDEDMKEQLQIMQQRMRRMEDKLRDAERRAGPAPAASDCFFCSIEFEGWVSGSYFWNHQGTAPGVEGPDLGGLNSGVGFYPFKPDHNSFQVDQVWFGMERPVSADQRAGFRLDMVIGKTGDILNGGNDGRSGSFQDFHLYQAYVQYLAPIAIGDGVTFKFGKFGTLIGAEVAQAPANFNITRGNVYNLFQPITHTGLLATTSPWEGGSVSVGLVNETRAFTAVDIDFNNNKAVTWQVAHEFNDTLSAAFNGAFGYADSGFGNSDSTPDGDKETILDWVVYWDPTEKLSTWLNIDYLQNEGGVGQIEGYGIAAAGRYAITDRMGVAGRMEWVDLSLSNGQDDIEVFGLTGTLDYLLTSNLQVRGELRWDQGTGGIEEVFFSSSHAARGVPGSGQQQDKDYQITAGVEVIYSF